MKRWRLLERLSGTDGNIAVIFAIALPAVIGVTGMSVESGYWYQKERQLQQAADAGAFAGATVLRDQSGSVEAAAYDEVGKFGFSGSNATIGISTPPSSGPNQNARSVEVTISFPARRFFSAVFSSDAVIVNARAVATFEEPTNACLLALDTAASGAVTFRGGSLVSVSKCEIMSNSIADDAAILTGGPSVTTPCINTVGDISISNNSNLTLTECKAARTNQQRAKDPYADRLPPETSGACDNLPPVTGGPGTSYTYDAGPTGVRRICSNVGLKRNHHFEPGVYILDGADLSINAGANVTGSGVTFYMTDGARVQMNGNATVELSAPTTGNFAGIAFWGDVANTTTTHIINGTASSSITGAIYAPGSIVSFNGNFSGIGGCMQLVARMIDFAGNASISTDCSGFGLEWAGVPGRVQVVE